MTDPSRSAALLDRASLVVPGGVHSGRRRTVPPFCVRRAYDQYVEDLDGRRYIDYRAGAGAVILGHADRSVDQRVAAAIKRGVLYGVGTTEAETELAELIVQHVPSIDQVLFCNSGSEATYHALRLARAITRRSHVIKFQGCYHGFHDSVLLNCETDTNMLGKVQRHSAGMADDVVRTVHVCRLNDIQDVARTFAAFSDDVAALIIEPIAHNGPGILPQPGFLSGLATLCREYGALLIFDEVITGFRHHIGGYQSIEGVFPDLTVLGKAMANGYPIAALGGRRDYMERFTTRPGGDTFWAGTYNANALGVAAALATIDRLADGAVYAHTYNLGTLMRDGLAEIVKRAGISACVAGYGSLFTLWFAPAPLSTYEDVACNDLPLFTRYRSELIRRGIFEYPTTDGARSHISASHTVADVEQTLTAANEALAAALADSRRQEQ